MRSVYHAPFDRVVALVDFGAMRHLLVSFLGLLWLFATSAAFAQVGTVRVASGLALPTYLTHAPLDFDRVFVTELFGDIEILDVATGTQRGTPFLSIPNVGGAHGLLCLAFHPDYASNGYFYVWFQETDDTIHLVRYTRSATDPDLADAGSALPILELPSTSGHVGGWIGFGPDDGYLYLTIGDGQDFVVHDALDHGQGIVGELFANVLRLDVDGDDFPGDPLRNYAIPPDNPFVGVTGEDEIWAYGLRNPWRASFDRVTGDLYIADVGQDSREEIDFERAGTGGGRNYGWRLREGFIATPTGPYGGPQPPNGVDPVYDYTHGPGPSEGASISGGYVYRGPVLELRGRYFFADFMSERIWSIRLDRQTELVTEFMDWTATFVPNVGSIEQIVSFGEDAAGDLYILEFGGEVFRVVGPLGQVPLFGAVGAAALGASLLAVAAGAFARRRRA
jgi:glucose/arabinose dehydrogenase